MIATVIFCLCVSGLCCYTVHMLLEDRKETQSAIYKAMAEIDEVVLNKPLKIPQKKLPLHLELKLKSLRPVTIINAINIKQEKLAHNTYPIIPSDKLAVGYGFDMRA